MSIFPPAHIRMSGTIFLPAGFRSFISNSHTDLAIPTLISCIWLISACLQFLLRLGSGDYIRARDVDSYPQQLRRHTLCTSERSPFCVKLTLALDGRERGQLPKGRPLGPWRWSITKSSFHRGLQLFQGRHRAPPTASHS